ncbi:putative major facilitator superfamily transporter [Gordonia otitidis NBRC 100426]|uniref:Major facilitator superfamily transporter n=1 Tax=Gordonia otitidis (strain DSM 44809 / CCUG 52243 / JCM 12355 / NBRC 100426 / IFM 10032) TaxID=1108044 RepID=H5TNV5_GORO1|nr:hypothetical protein [Gordonia otitidis]GAB35163.1 putative major facilitator superfamily transporter [Gordonia otitidis NBRC 100426]
MTTTQADGTGAVGKRTPRHAALAGFMGSAVEYYDFFLFGSAAALIFPHIFFPSDDNAALVMSFATFGVAYIARPIGALILGPLRRSHRPPEGVDVHARADGSVDVRHRLPTDVQSDRLACSHPARDLPSAAGLFGRR